MEVNAAKMGGGLGWSKGNKKWKGIYDVVFMSLRELNTGRGEEREEELRAFLFFFFLFFFSFFFSLFRLPLSLFVLGRAVPSGPEHSRSNAFSLLK